MNAKLLPRRSASGSGTGPAAGKAFWALRDFCIASKDEIMRTFGIYILVPRSQLKGTGGAEDWAAASAEDALKETLS